MGHTWVVERVFSAPTEADQDQLYRVVADLGTYPEWLTLVHQAQPSGTGPDDPGEPAWSITLRARVGPLARSKRLRMVRTVDDGRRVRFERQELDGREHSAWTLSATVGPPPDPAGGADTAPNDVGGGDDRSRWQSQVTLELRYAGSLWSGLLDPVLQSAADDATARLQSYLAATTP